MITHITDVLGIPGTPQEQLEFVNVRLAPDTKLFIGCHMKLRHVSELFNELDELFIVTYYRHRLIPPLASRNKDRTHSAADLTAASRSYGRSPCRSLSPKACYQNSTPLARPQYPTDLELSYCILLMLLCYQRD